MQAIQKNTAQQMNSTSDATKVSPSGPVPCPALPRPVLPSQHSLPSLPASSAKHLEGSATRLPRLACPPSFLPPQLRAIAAYGLQQMIDFVRNASTAVPVAGTSYTGRRRS